MQESPRPMAIIGAGTVAQALGRCLHTHREPVIALASRTQASAERAAAFVGSSVQAVTCSAIPRLTNRVIIAVADEGIAPVAKALAAAEMTGIVLHTSGASGLAPLAALREAGVACGVLHPLQTVVSPEHGASQFDGVAFGVAGDREAVDWAEAIVAILNGDVLRLSADNLPSYHAGAVMASNALIAAIDAALVLMRQAGVEPERALRAIGPLSRASVENTLRLGPQAALTGPVVRGDTATVAAHVAAVDRAPTSVAALYRATAQHLLSLAREQELPPTTLRALAQMLECRHVEDHDAREEGSNH